jgi:multicomponent Na+:H+ antiporter subunit G
MSEAETMAAVSMVAEWIVALCLLGGGAFALIAAIGLLRMRDVFIRMHAATKAGTLGVGLILVATGLAFLEWGVALRAVAAIAFLIITAPVAAHLIARAAYRTGTPLWAGSVVDEWGAALGKDARRTAAGPEHGKQRRNKEAVSDEAVQEHPGRP